MKQIVHWLTTMFVTLLVLTFGAGVQSVNAQSELAEGYYYIYSTVTDASYVGLGMYYGTTGNTQRIQAKKHDAGLQVTKEDQPFVFHVTKAADGEHYNVQNFVSKGYWGRWEGAKDNDPGGGFGFVESPEPFTITPYGANTYTMEYAQTDRYPAHGGMVHAQDDGYVGFWGDAGSIYAHKVWEFVPVDEKTLFNPVEVSEVEGNTPDGYYYINIPGANDPTSCVVPVNSDQLWRLGAYPREEENFDESYVWHITKNADGETYSIKNCGAQDLTYIENITKGDKASPYILMTGTNPAKFRFKYMSDGSIYIYSTDNNFNYSLNNSTGNMATVNAQNSNSAMKFIEVPADKITNALKLQEAITNAAGRQFTVGENPGQVSQADYDAFNTVYEKATAAAGSDEDHTALINELNEATNTLISKTIPVSEGFYTFENCATEGDYLKPYFKNNEWYLGHDIVDFTLDISAVWHVIKNADGNLVLKNCGTQDSTYMVSVSKDYVWGLPRMAGTSKNYQIFKNEYSNMFKLYASDNHNFWNADGGNVVSSNNDYHPKDGLWKIVKVSDEYIPFMTKLNEAITDAAGTVKDSGVGVNPGDNLGDPTELNQAISDARTMYDEASATDEEVEQAIAKLQEETKKFLEQDHSMRGIEDGTYYIVSTQDGFQEKGKIAMYIPKNQYVSWKVLREKDPSYIFNIKSLGNGEYSIESFLYGTYIAKNTPNAVETSTEQTVPQKFNYLGNGTWDILNTVDNSPYTLRTYKSETSGVVNIKDASGIHTWTLRRVTDQHLIDSLMPVAKQTRLTVALEAAVQKAEPAYKNTFKYDRTEGLITEVNEENPRAGQVWGSQVDDSYTSYGHLIDGDLNTCFQSSWNYGPSVVEEGKGTQPFQVDLRDHPVDNFEFYFGLREGDWGWKECWSNIDVYATNDGSVAGKDDIDPAEWTYVGNYTDLVSYIRPEGASMTSSGRYLQYPISNLDQKYRYIRFIVRSTISPQSCMMYTIGEFQIYGIELNEANSPYNYVEGLKPLADELKGLIDDAKAKISGNTATQEEIDRLEALTKQVVALTPNTNPLDERLDAVKKYVGKFADEDNWGDVTSEQLETMNAAIDDAEGYDHDQPQQADLEQRLASLNAAFALYKSQQKLPDTNTWYYISNTDKQRQGHTSEGGTGSSVYDTWCFGNVITAPRTNTTASKYWNNWDGAIKWDGYDHASNTLSDSIYSDPYTMWRLVPAETAGEYAIQNRATGYYIGVYGNKNGTGGLSATPVPYKVNLLKSGQFNLICDDAEANSNNIPLHADGRKILVSWDGTEDSPSSWTFEPIADDVENLEINIANNSATILTLPYAYDNENISGMNKENLIFTYGIKGVSEDGTKLLLCNKRTFEAGEPMIVIAGDINAESVTTDEKTKMFLPLANEFSHDVKPANGLVGVLDYDSVPNYAGTIYKDSVISTETGKVYLMGQSGYVDVSAVVNNNDVETAATLNLKGEFVNNIAPATTVSGKVNVYTVDGVLVKKNVKAEKATQGLRKGVYIIGKQKVLVK